DIVIVEPGEPDAVFGDVDFWDYVIVEGSNDNGATWVPLLDGYDATFDDAWFSAWITAGTASPDMFRNHQINLLGFFSAGEEIILRWRLFADAAVNGYGWVIDNITYKDNLVSVDAGEQLPRVFSLSLNYPNPFNPATQIKYALPQSAEVSLQIFNVLGQRVRDLVRNQKQDAGRYSVQWDGNNDFGQPVSSGIYVYRISAGEFTKSFKMTLLK
ncbi:MAG: T9SS type A sorting domain-containing protein, partial [Calditrichaeota bacterium]|nr:T9SS type A sorting domain-containing protein [Calditrichota bacterium]